MSRLVRILIRILLGLAGLIVVTLIAVFFIVHSQWFHDYLRQQIISRMEKATGGHVQFQRFELTTFTYTMRNFVIHGAEPAGTAPLFEAPAITVKVAVLPSFHQIIGLEYVGVDRPSIHVLVSRDGKTNIPSPKIQSKPGSKSGLQELIDLSIQRIDVSNGSIHFSDTQIPLEVHGRNLHIGLSYNTGSREYQGELSMAAAAEDRAPIQAQIALPVVLQRDAIVISGARIQTAASSLTANVAIRNLAAPRITLQTDAHIALAELARFTGAPLRTGRGVPGALDVQAALQANRQGIDVENAAVTLGNAHLEAASAGGTKANFRGSLSLDQLAELFGETSWPAGTIQAGGTADLSLPNYSISGTLTASDLSVKQARLGRVQLASSFELAPNRIQVPKLIIDVLGGRIRATANLNHFQTIEAHAELSKFNLETLTRKLSAPRMAYSGTVSGDVQVSGALRTPDVRLSVAISPGRTGIPVAGQARAAYSFSDHALSVADSLIHLPHSRLTLSGEPGHEATLQLVSTNLHDLLPAVGMISASQRIPVQLNGGTAGLTITERGPLDRPQLSGDLLLQDFLMDRRRFQRVTANLSASSARASGQGEILVHGDSHAQFSAAVGLRNWKPEPSEPLTANLEIQKGELADFLTLAGESRLPAAGSLTASAHFSGSVGNPLGTIRLSVLNGRIYGDSFDRARLSADLSDRLVSLHTLEISAGTARVAIQGTFSHPRNDLATGLIRAQLRASDFELAQLHTLQEKRRGLSGMVDANGDVSGNLTRKNGTIRFVPTAIDGNLRAENIRDDRQIYGNLTATAQTRGTAVDASVQSNFAGSAIEVHGTAALTDGYPVNATFSMAHLPIEKAAAILSPEPIPARGLLTVRGSVAGPIREPRAGITLELARSELYQEPIESLAATVEFSGTEIAVPSLRLTAPAGRISLSGTYAPSPSGFKTGQVSLSITMPGLEMQKVRHLHDLEPGVSGVVQFTGDVLADVRAAGSGEQVFPVRINAAAGFRDLSWNGHPLGGASFDARTRGSTLSASLRADLAQSSIQGSGDVQLYGEYPSNLNLSFSGVSYSRLKPLLASGPDGIDASAAGQASFHGPLLRPGLASGLLQLSELRISAQDFVLKNTGDIRVQLAHQTLQIDNARLSGPSTDIAISGSAGLSRSSALDLAIKGNADLSYFKKISPGAVASGLVDLTSTVRGTYAKPNIDGRVSVKNASFQLVSWPNGVYNANGVILLSGAGGTIQSFTAESGGGKINVQGFFGYGAARVNYDFRATARQVRTRYSGASVTADGDATLSGTLQRGLLNGTVTITRIGYGQQSDIGSILSRSTRPTTPPAAAAGPLSAIRTNLRIQTASGVQFQTTLAQQLSATADLTMLGSLESPGMVGRVNITGGTLVFFGNKYAVDRGSISFYDANSIRPILDIDLQTSAQGVSVNLTVSGPIDDLKLTYRSDPPLKFQDIIALLAAGKTPPDPTIAVNQPVAPDQNAMQMGESAILGQAIANPIASRLQRVFGVTQLSIAPTFVSGTALPQARVTVQQQVSSGLTFTYSQDLSQTNSQLIRVEWQFTPRFSAVATRDENGIFGVDFYYKKNFH